MFINGFHAVDKVTMKGIGFRSPLGKRHLFQGGYMRYKTAWHRFMQYIGIILALAAAAGPAYANGEAELTLAEEAVVNFRYGVALDHFRAAAAKGNRLAQRTAGLMLLKGSALYGSEVPANPTEAIKWLRAAAANGCNVSKFVLAREARAGRISS